MLSSWLYAVGVGAIIVAVVSYFLKLPRYQSVKGLHVCIPGGSSGIGLALAKQCAAEGARKVTIIARRMEVLKEALNEVKRIDPDCDVAIISCDITDPQKVDEMFEKELVADSIDWLLTTRIFPRWPLLTKRPVSVDGVSKFGSFDFNLERASAWAFCSPSICFVIAA